jgi:hypothetical protein
MIHSKYISHNHCVSFHWQIMLSLVHQAKKHISRVEGPNSHFTTCVCHFIITEYLPLADPVVFGASSQKNISPGWKGRIHILLHVSAISQSLSIFHWQIMLSLVHQAKKTYLQGGRAESTFYYIVSRLTSISQSCESGETISRTTFSFVVNSVQDL